MRIRTRLQHYNITAALIVSVLAVACVSPPRKNATVENIAIGGTVVGIDNDGIEVRGRDGELTFVEWRGGEGTTRNVKVQNGRWNAEVATDANIQIFDATLGEQIFSIRTFPILAKRLQNIQWMGHAQSPDEDRLSVVDADTHRELQHIEIVTIDLGPSNRTTLHPGLGDNIQIIEREASSPLRRSPTNYPGSSSYALLRAPGYAWKFVPTLNLFFATMGFRPIENDPLILQKEAIANIIISDDVPADAHLIIYRTPESAEEEVPKREGSAIQTIPTDPYIHEIADIELRGRRAFRLDGLPRESLTFVLCERRPAEAIRIFEIREADFSSRHEQSLLLQLKNPDGRQNITLRGTVNLEAGYDPENIILHISPERTGDPFFSRQTIELTKKSLKRLPGDKIQYIQYSFAIERMRPGDYRIQEGETLSSKNFQLSEGGAQIVNLDIPRPTKVILHFVRAKTGEPIEVRDVEWHPLEDVSSVTGLSGAMMTDPARRDDKDNPGAYFFYTIFDGATVYFNFDDEMDFGRAHFPVEGALQHQKIEVSRSLQLSVALKENGHILYAPGDYITFDLTAEGHDGAIICSGRPVIYEQFGVTKPGPYRLKVKLPAAYEPIEDQIVNIEPEKPPVLTIPVKYKNSLRGSTEDH